MFLDSGTNSTVGAHGGSSQWEPPLLDPTAKLAVGFTVRAPTAKKKLQHSARRCPRWPGHVLQDGPRLHGWLTRARSCARSLQCYMRTRSCAGRQSVREPVGAVGIATATKTNLVRNHARLRHSADAASLRGFAPALAVTPTTVPSSACTSCSAPRDGCGDAPFLGPLLQSAEGSGARQRISDPLAGSAARLVCRSPRAPGSPENTNTCGMAWRVSVPASYGAVAGARRERQRAVRGVAGRRTRQTVRACRSRSRRYLTW